jgi:hypothetical protein
MPNLLTPDLARFLSTPQPVLLVALSADMPSLPPLARDASGSPAHLAGWSVLAGATLCVVDGPGEQGFLLPTIGGPFGDSASDSDGGDGGMEQMKASLAWAAGVEDCGGAYVLQVAEDELDAPLAQLISKPVARGGFVESVR